MGRICFWVFIILAIMAPAQLYRCLPNCRLHDGWVYHRLRWARYGWRTSGEGSDIITINVGADLTKTDVQLIDVTATANAITINAESGNDQITNNGKVRTNATFLIYPPDFVMTLLGSNEANASITGNAVATGIDGGCQ